MSGMDSRDMRSNPSLDRGTDNKNSPSSDVKKQEDDSNLVSEKKKRVANMCAMESKDDNMRF